MPYCDREAYNARRRARYHSDHDFRRAENDRTCRHQRAFRGAARVAALPSVPASSFAGLVGLSRHQLGVLYRRRIIPKFEGGRGCPRTVTTSQIFWSITALFVFRRQPHWHSARIREAVNLAKLQRFLQLVWHEPFPLTRATEALLVHAAAELAGREIQVGMPHELRRQAEYLKAREALG